jgi:hypothetical protein
VLKQPKEKREAYIQRKFDNIYNLSVSQIQQLRIAGKQYMMKEGDFHRALDQSLIKAYVAYERFNWDEVQSS